jgi:hypothetical protein
MNPDPMPNDPPDDELSALFRAVRENPPDVSRTEFAFETRVMARVREERRASMFSWAWKLTPFFAALAIIAGVWCYVRTGLEADPDALLTALSDGGRSAVEWFTEDGS